MQVIDSDWSELHQIDFKKYGHSSQMSIKKFCADILNKKIDDTLFFAYLKTANVEKEFSPKLIEFKVKFATSWKPKF